MLLIENGSIKTNLDVFGVWWEKKTKETKKKSLKQFSFFFNEDDPCVIVLFNWEKKRLVWFSKKSVKNQDQTINMVTRKREIFSKKCKRHVDCSY